MRDGNYLFPSGRAAAALPETVCACAVPVAGCRANRNRRRKRLRRLRRFGISANIAHAAWRFHAEPIIAQWRVVGEEGEGIPACRWMTDD